MDKEHTLNIVGGYVDISRLSKEESFDISLTEEKKDPEEDKKKSRKVYKVIATDNLKNIKYLKIYSNRKKNEWKTAHHSCYGV